MGEFVALLIVLACICIPAVIIVVLFALSAVIAVGAIVPMYIAFGIGFLFKEVFRAYTYIYPRRAIDG